MTTIKQDRHQRFVKAREARQREEAHNFLRDAPGLLDDLDTIDRERGGPCNAEVDAKRVDLQGILRRIDLPAIERASLVRVGLQNLCHVMNQRRPPGALLLDITGWIDPNDTHYGALRIAAHFEIVRLTIAEYERVAALPKGRE